MEEIKVISDIIRKLSESNNQKKKCFFCNDYKSPCYYFKREWKEKVTEKWKEENKDFSSLTSSEWNRKICFRHFQLGDFYLKKNQIHLKNEASPVEEEVFSFFVEETFVEAVEFEENVVREVIAVDLDTASGVREVTLQELRLNGAIAAGDFQLKKIKKFLMKAPEKFNIIVDSIHVDVMSPSLGFSQELDRIVGFITPTIGSFNASPCKGIMFFFAAGIERGFCLPLGYLNTEEGEPTLKEFRDNVEILTSTLETMDIKPNAFVADKVQGHYGMMQLGEWGNIQISNTNLFFYWDIYHSLTAAINHVFLNDITFFDTREEGEIVTRVSHASSFEKVVIKPRHIRILDLAARKVTRGAESLRDITEDSIISDLKNLTRDELAPEILKNLQTLVKIFILKKTMKRDSEEHVMLERMLPFFLNLAKAVKPFNPHLKCFYGIYCFLFSINENLKSIEEIFLPSFNTEIIEQKIARRGLHDKTICLNLKISTLFPTWWNEALNVPPPNLRQTSVTKEINVDGFLLEFMSGLEFVKFCCKCGGHCDLNEVHAKHYIDLQMLLGDHEIVIKGGISTFLRQKLIELSKIDFPDFYNEEHQCFENRMEALIGFIYRELRNFCEKMGFEYYRSKKNRLQ